MTPLALPTNTGTSQRATGWDRIAILTLGAAGCALSYDALQQMAVAIHVRGILTYLFPLVIDGFIAYGVRALLVLRTAPFHARLYVWALFGIATTASVWANALHAVRLNQQATTGDLHLGDATVGLLAMLAPLALAGAVHLHILIARHTTDAPLHGIPADHSRGQEGPIGILPGSDGPTAATDTPPADETANDLAEDRDADRQPPASPQGFSVQKVPGPPAVGEPQDKVTSAGDSPTGSSGGVTAGKPAGRPPGASLDDLLAIGRQAATDAGMLSRTVVTKAVRAHGITLSSDRLTAVMDRLRAEESAEQLTLR
ncbi:DUF2637 domain-containing protein [Streptomyces sp. SID13666]|uniref:DUF2637 domain-containing protein n=1 Tax=Streptomyces TaxID=1883 RepID=UPI0013C0A047|nr:MULTISPECIES: DUF2637 domain-containing protein [unclassified Streptomyces]MDF9814186.1 hypothetical protein [Streptomyces sp. SPB162]NEA55632.1 DUF2637 domain-containing protein [Streptomyces sp. SID13666]